MNETIGARLKELRLQKDYTQEYVGNIIGVSKQTLYKYENGIVTNIPSDKIEALAKVYGVTPDYIMGWTTPDSAPVPAIALMELSPHEIHIALAYHEADDRDKAIVDMTLEPYIKEYVLGKFSKHYKHFSSAIKYYYPHLSHDEAERLLMDIICTPSLDLAIEQSETHYATDIVIKCIVQFYNNFIEYMENTPSLDKIKQFIHEYVPPKSP